MNEKEKALEIYERNSNILSVHIFNGHHDIAIELSINEATQVLNSFDYKYPYSKETEDMEWTSDDQYLFSLYNNYWNNVIKELRLLN
jgi:hypothetical protein